MKTLFLGGLAARVAPRILGKMSMKFDATVLADLADIKRLIPALAEAEIVVGHIWREEFPEAPRLKLLQAATAGIDMIDVSALPRSITLCNAFGHETAIAEYVLMTMLALTHRLLDTVMELRAGSWAAHQPGGGPPHGEIFRKTIGIIGYRRSAARSRGAPSRSAARSSRPTAVRSQIRGRHRKSIRLPSLTGCCRDATPC
jgi:phosphoglycerate dehydrogenase-like enzyme